MHQPNQHDRELLARNLGLSLERFDKLLFSANHAYDVIKNLGPFYGKPGSLEPTFRITAEPVQIPGRYEQILLTFGSDLLHLGNALSRLPGKYQAILGASVDFKVPPTWRIDTILDETGNIRINEIEGVDCAGALMIAEQLAYNLQELPQSTAATLAAALKAFTHADGLFKVALIYPNLATDPYTPNFRKFVKLVSDLSNGALKVDLIDEKEIRNGTIKPDWQTYKGIIDESYLTPKELRSLGIKEHQMVSAGFYNAIANKGLFGLVFDPELEPFWTAEISKERLDRLKKIMIPTRFIENKKQLDEARTAGQVVKIYWADSTEITLDRGYGVAMPDGNTRHHTDERWEKLKHLLKDGVRLIAQEYIKPGKIHSYLRKKGTNLQAVDWYNRICFKYVCNGNPNTTIPLPEVKITAIEATLGPDVVPAGRECSFTAGMFVG